MTADRALEAVRALPGEYRLDLRRPDGLWTATCPCCWPLYSDGPTLTIVESVRGGRVHLHCTKRCDRVAIERALQQALAPSVDAGELVRRAEQLAALAERRLALAADLVKAAQAERRVAA
jgi:hypothetical protein